MELLEIINNGPEILETNYWRTPHAEHGYYFLSINAGCFRLLVPPIQEREIEEWRSAQEVIISRGPWPQAGQRDALEILFDDGSEDPYAIHLDVRQIDRLPVAADQGRTSPFVVWTQAGKYLELTARYRIVKKLPYLKSWE